MGAVWSRPLDFHVQASFSHGLIAGRADGWLDNVPKRVCCLWLEVSPKQLKWKRDRKGEEKGVGEEEGSRCLTSGPMQARTPCILRQTLPSISSLHNILVIFKMLALRRTVAIGETGTSAIDPGLSEATLSPPAADGHSHVAGFFPESQQAPLHHAVACILPLSM